MANLNLYQDILLQKLKDHPDYVGYYLQKYSELENLSQNDLLNILACSEEGFIKLALCRTASPFSADFAGSIDKISKYVDVDDLSLSQIIKKVAISEKQAKGRIVGMPSKENLMAAREKEEKEKNTDQEEKNK